MHYDRVTRAFHMFLALGIVLQVVASTMMVVPRPGRAADTWWGIHEYLGMTLGVILILHWLWTVRATALRGEAYLLFPWFSSRKLGLLVDDFKDTLNALRSGRLPEVGDKPRALPAALQSLGLILATLLALTGTCIGLVVEGVIDRPSFFGLVREAHGIGGNLMWLYLVAHPLIAVAHEVAGQRLIGGMFTLAANDTDRRPS